MSGKLGLTLGLTAGAAAVGGLFYFAFAPVADVASEERRRDGNVAEEESSPAKTHRKVSEVAVKKPERRDETDPSSRKRPHAFTGMTKTKDWYETLPSGRDRALGKRIQDAMDSDDRAAVFAAADEALDSKNVDVRRAAVDALSLQGEAAASNLVAFVADSDSDTAEAAYFAWDHAVDQMEADSRKIEAITQVAETAKNPELVERAVARIEDLDESTSTRLLTAMATAENPAVAKAARKAYENVTGKSWQGKGAALLERISSKIERRVDEAEANGEDLPAEF